MTATVPAYVQPIPMCGTRTGAARHRRLGEPRCEPCWAAEREYKNAHRNPHQPAPDLPHWEGAACRGMDTEAFFPHRTDSRTAQDAVAVCQDCPIRAACAAWALAHEHYGIFGGLTPEQRDELRRSR